MPVYEEPAGWIDPSSGQWIPNLNAGAPEPEPTPSAPTPEPTPTKPDFTTTQTEAQREQELRDALTNAEANREQLAAEGQDTSAFDQSVQDVAAKVGIIDSYKAADEPMPPEVKAVIYGPLAGFTDLSKGEIDVTNAVRAGVSDSELTKAGISKDVINEAKQYVEQTKLSRAEIAEQNEALEKLDKYKEGDGYDIAKAVKDGHTRLVKKAGFTDEQIKAAKAAPAALTGKAAFDQLVKDGKIPEGSRFDHIDEQGNIVYFPPFAGVEEVRGEFEKLDKRTQMRYVSQTLNPPVLSSDTMTQQKNPFAARSYDQLSQADKERVLAQYRLDKALDQMNKDTAIGLIPIVGTVYTWKRTSTPWRAVNIATDVLTVVPMGKVTRLMKGTAGEVEAMIRVGRGAERATLKATAPKEVVRAYDSYVKAVDDFAKNRTFIRQAEKDVAKGIKSEVIRTGPEGRTLQAAREVDAQLALKVQRTGDAFANAQKIAEAKRLKVVGKAGIEDANLADFGSRSVHNVRTTVDAAFAEKIPKVSQIEQQIRGNQKAIEAAAKRRDVAQVRDLTQRAAELQAKLKVAKSGEMRALHSDYTLLGQQIGDVETALKARTTTPKAKAALRQELKELRLERLKVEKKLVESMKYQEIYWAKPYSKGGGGMGRPYEPKEPWRGGGGGRVEAPTRTTYARQGAKLVYRDSEGNEIWELPGVRTIDVPGKETVRVEPQPYWAFVTAPTKPGTEPRIYPETEPYVIPQPETEPARRPPFEPKPGRITWTPSVAPMPKPKPVTSPETHPEPEPGTVVGPAPKTGPSTGPKTGTETKPGEKTKGGTETKPVTAPGTETKPGTGTKPTTKTKPTTQPGERVQPAPIPKGGIKIPVPIPTPVPTPVPVKYLPTKLPRPEVKGGKDWTKKELESAAAWNQGIGIWAVRPPGGADDWKFWRTEEAPQELKVTGRKTAYDTIRLWKGTKSFQATKDLGIVFVDIKRPTKRLGSPGTIAFRPDYRDIGRRRSKARLSKDIYSRKGTLSHVARRSATRMSRGGILR